SVTDAAWMKFATTQGALATSPYVAYSSTDTTDLIGPDGLKVIWARYADAALNDSVATSDTIILDTTGPSTSSVSPSEGATGVATGTTVEVVFDETNEMDPSSIEGTTFYLKNSSGTTITATLVYTPGTKTAVLTPTSPLVEGETYTAYLTNGITDGAGNPGAPYSWSFTVLDSSEPDASFIEPSDGSTITTSSFNINGMATDAIGVSTVTISITRDSDGFTWDGSGFTAPATTVTSTLGTPDGTSTSWSYIWSPTPSVNGDTYTIVATASDTSGNPDSSPPSVSVAIDRVAPSIGATDFLIDNDATYTADLSVDLNSSVTDAAWMKFATTQGALATSPYVAY
ncbi:hypothetical protein LCGC14_3115870, partial [marine sediment metagenome]